MSKQDDNKAVVGRWFTEFWGKDVNLAVVDEIAAPDMLLEIFAARASPRARRHQGVHDRLPRRVPRPELLGDGRSDRRGRHVVGRWEGGGTHTGPAFNDFLVGSLPAATGRKMRFTGTTVLKVIDGRIVEEVGLDDGVAALTQLGLLRRRLIERGPLIHCREQTRGPARSEHHSALPGL